jgi:cephalosporin hydroxylase
MDQNFHAQSRTTPDGFSELGLNPSGHRMKIPIGSYRVDCDQPSLDPTEREIVSRFHDIYYRRWQRGADTINADWCGYQLLKCPLDLWIYQELLVRRRPDLVIETGTYQGGSALFMATIMDLVGHGRVITIDVESRDGLPEHPRISYWTGSSIDDAIVKEARKALAAGRAMIVLDSDHSEAHVFRELMSYSPLVQIDDYLVVEDTNINGHPAFANFGPGPMEAVDRFLSQSDEFIPDQRCERFLMTLNPKGYLKRVRSPAGLR